MRLLEFFRPFRLVVSRRVSEEEQVSVEAFYSNIDRAKTGLETVLGTMRDHRKRSNEEVVRATQTQLASLDTALSNRGEQIKAADEQLAEKHAELRRLNEEINKKRGKVGLAPQPIAPAIGIGATRANGPIRTGL